MRRRDRQSEVVVAVIAFGVIALALTFGIILSLGNGDEMPPPETRPSNILVIENNVSATHTLSLPENNDNSATDVAEAVPSTSPIPSATDTATATATDQPTDTPSPSHTSSPSPTLEATPPPTVAIRNSRQAGSNTPTATALPSNTINPTEPSSTTEPPSATLTTTASQTATNSPTHTDTATETSSFTPSFTATASPSNTVTPSATQTATLTATPSNSPTPTPSDTPSVTPSPTASVSPSITPFPTLTITPFVLPSTRRACQPVAGWATYVVQSGDILFEIARASGLRTEALRQANCLDTSQIFAGQSLQIPPDSPLLTPSASSSANNNCSNSGAQISYPRQNDSLAAPFVVRGLADDDYFGYYRLIVVPNESTAFVVAESNRRISMQDSLGTVNLPEFPAGEYHIRLEVYNQWSSLSAVCEVRVRFGQ